MTPDFYRQRLKRAGWGWMERGRFEGNPRRKDRASGRCVKRGARQEALRDAARDADDAVDFLSSDPCQNGTCPMCHDGGAEAEFERTRMAAANRGAI